MPLKIQAAQEEKIARAVLGQIFQDDENINDYIEIAKAIVAGKTFCQGLGLKEKDLDVMLAIAANQYNAARYQDAARLYSLAALLNHFDTRAMQGAGMALHKLGLFNAAQQCFAAFLLQEPENLEVNFMLAESMAMSGRRAEALDLLSQIAKRGKAMVDSASNRSISKRASALIALLSKQSESEITSESLINKEAYP